MRKQKLFVLLWMLVLCSLMSTEVAGGFTGVVLGMFAEGKEKSGYADFGYFRYNEK